MNSQLKEVENLYNSIADKVKEEFFKLQNETYLNLTLNEIREQLRTKYHKEENHKNIIPYLEAYQATKKELEDVKTKIHFREEMDKTLNDLMNQQQQLTEEIEEIRKECESLLDDIINYDDNELRALREKKQRRMLTKSSHVKF